MVRGLIHVIVGTDEDWTTSNAKRKGHMSRVMLVNAPKRRCQQGKWSVEFSNKDKELICDEMKRMIQWLFL